jgi:hypothetical protein
MCCEKEKKLIRYRGKNCHYKGMGENPDYLLLFLGYRGKFILPLATIRQGRRMAIKNNIHIAITTHIYGPNKIIEELQIMHTFLYKYGVVDVVFQ